MMPFPNNSQWLRPLTLGFLALVMLSKQATMGTRNCESNVDCGWNSRCRGNSCVCLTGFTMSYNSRDCIDGKCSDSLCVDCSRERSKCRRCAGFLDKQTGKCVRECNSKFYLSLQGEQVGKICGEEQAEGENLMMKLYVPIIAGLCALILISVIVALVLYWYMTVHSMNRVMQDISSEVKQQRKKKQAAGQSETRTSPVRYDQISPAAYENFGYVRHNNDSERTPKADKKYFKMVTSLKRHIGLFREMLGEVMEKSQGPLIDRRRALYRDVIHQLCRVLAILTNEQIHEDPVPPDGNELLDWAVKILKAYCESHQYHVPNIKSASYKEEQPSPARGYQLSQADFQGQSTFENHMDEPPDPYSSDPVGLAMSNHSLASQPSVINKGAREAGSYLSSHESVIQRLPKSTLDEQYQESSLTEIPTQNGSRSNKNRFRSNQNGSESSQNGAASTQSGSRSTQNESRSQESRSQGATNLPETETEMFVDAEPEVEQEIILEDNLREEDPRLNKKRNPPPEDTTIQLPLSVSLSEEETIYILGDLTEPISV